MKIVVGAHDAYSAAWGAMVHGLKKYWPDCPWEIVFITNNLDAPKGCKTVKVGGGFERERWSNRVIRGLKQVKADTILWMIDDHWVTKRPDVPALIEFAKMVGKGKVARLRLFPGLGHDFGKPHRRDERLIVLDKMSPYRCSCKPSFWDRKTFLSLLKPGESPWDFENRGRGRSVKHEFAVTKDWHWFFVTNGCPDGGKWEKSPIVKGKWTRAAKRYAKREGLKIDFRKHPVMGNPFGRDKPSYILP